MKLKTRLVQRRRPRAAQWLSVAVALTIAIAVAGCGSDDKTAAEPSKFSDWQKGAPAEWQSILKKAKDEGEVSIAGPAQLADGMAAAFERDTGIKLNWLGLNSEDLNSRLDQEAQSGNVTIDLSFGGGTQLTTLMPQKLLQPLAPQIILPAAGASHWQGGKLKWLDNAETYMLQTTQYVFAWLTVNPDKIDVDSIKTMDDLLSPDLKGKIAAYDPRSGGQGQSAAAYYASLGGQEYVKKLYLGQDVTMTQDGRQLVEYVARGTYPIAIGAVAPDVSTFQDQGLPVEVVGLEDAPGTLTGGFSILKQPVGVPHPNAAQVFLNWYLAGPGLETYSKTMTEPALRTDISLPSKYDYLVAQDGVDYLDQYREDWYVNERPKLKEELEAAFS